MKISVIIPVFRTERFLRQCVDSILNQIYEELEVVLIDDGSPDSSASICQSYVDKDRRVFLIHKHNGGLSDARNIGVMFASGDYAIFVDSDDYLEQCDAIEKICSRLEKTKCDVVNYSYCKVFEHDGKRVTMIQAKDMPDNIHSLDEQLNYVFANRVFITSACNKAIAVPLLKQLHFEEGRYSEDVLWTANLLVNVKSMDYIADCIYCYRQNTSSISQNIGSKNISDLAHAIEECYNIYMALDNDDIVKECLGKYLAYQFSTLIAVQSFTQRFEFETIKRMRAYSNILHYHGNQSKVKYMLWGVRAFGLVLWCRIIRATRWYWDTRREKI